MSPSVGHNTPSMASYQAREEALRLKELALMREEEALSRAEESNRSWINSQTYLSTFDTKPHHSQMSPVIPGLQEMSPTAVDDAPSALPYPGTMPRPWASGPLPASGHVRTYASAQDASNRLGVTVPPARPPRLPPMEIDVSRSHQPSWSSTAHSGGVPTSQLSFSTSNHTPFQHEDFVLPRTASEGVPPSPPVSVGPALKTDGSLLLQPPKDAPRDDHHHANEHGKERQHHSLWKMKGPGFGSSGRLKPRIKSDAESGDKEKTGAAASRQEESASDDEKNKHNRSKDGNFSEDDEEEGYTSPEGDEREASSRSPGERRGKKKRYYPKMNKALTVTRTVKVHKLNEMGEIVDRKGHNAWEMACGLQLGIRVMVSVNCQVTHAAVPDFDTFQQHVKLKFPAGGGPTTPPHDGPSFKFKDYAPIIFSNLREMFSIDTADYLVALCNTRDDGTNALRIMGTPGKSGSLFFFSHDMRFIVKTIPKREAMLLREVLPAYYQHVRQNPGTYLPRFYGLYRWKHEYTRKNVRFVVMNNIFATSLAIHKRFDIKGSTLGRTASASERKKGPRTIFKDLDIKETGFKIKLGAARKKLVLDQIRSDCHLLMSLKIMDYSLLLGVHDRRMDGTNQDTPHHPGWTNDPTNSQDKMGEGGAYNPSGIEGLLQDGQPAGERYFLGVIDILMLYTRRKKMERVWKTMTGGEGAGKGGVSSQPPPKYAIRFCNFLESVIE